MRPEKLTLEKIAKLAGVSSATVSRVVNNYPHVRPEVRERVSRIIAETGFQPNFIARSLASDRSRIIGLVIPSAPGLVFADPFFPSLIQGITQITNRSNLTLSLFLLHSKDEEVRTVQSILSTGLLDGVIVTADRHGDTLMPQLLERRFPFVLVGRPEIGNNISYVDTDNIGGAFIATDHLIKLGRRRIAAIGSDQNTAGDDRLDGYRSALRDAGMEIDPNLIVYGDFSMNSGYNAMNEIIPFNPDAVFVSSDTMALGALRAIREARLRVPEDIAVIGFDDLPPALQADPPLTTIRHPIEQLGTTAVELLMSLMEDRSTPVKHIILPTRLIVRTSCGAETPDLRHSVYRGGHRK